VFASDAQSSVRRPRCTMKASIGPGRANRVRPNRTSRAGLIAGDDRPADRVGVPAAVLRRRVHYRVGAEPSGRWIAGVANCCRRRRARRRGTRRSLRFDDVHSGLVVVSTQITRVVGRTAAAPASGSVLIDEVVLRPLATAPVTAGTSRRRDAGQARRWSPSDSAAFSSACVAAMPLENDAGEPAPRARQRPLERRARRLPSARSRILDELAGRGLHVCLVSGGSGGMTEP